MALSYERAGEMDRAFQALAKAVDHRCYAFIFLKADPALAALRGDPRFDVLVRRLNLPH
jgi:hypothetical protein